MSWTRVRSKFAERTLATVCPFGSKRVTPESRVGPNQERWSLVEGESTGGDLLIQPGEHP